MNSSWIELLWLVWDQSQSKYHLRTKFQDGIDKPQKRMLSPNAPTEKKTKYLNE
jgi:hypothetical protein